MSFFAIALFIVIYGCFVLADQQLPDSCQDGDSIYACNPAGAACSPLGSEYEPPGSGQIWWSECCTVSETSDTDYSFITKTYCYSWSLKGYPHNLHHGMMLPRCEENAVSTTAWKLEGQCKTSDSTVSHFTLFSCRILSAAIIHNIMFSHSLLIR